MDTDRFDRLTRSVEVRSRRRLLGVLSGFTMTLGALTAFPDVAAKKKRKKKPKQSRSECPICRSAPPPALTCSQACPQACTFCFRRTQGLGMLCGDGAGGVCDLPCASDSDCPDSAPFCVSHYVARATEMATAYCPGFPTAGGFCLTGPIAC